MKVKELINYGRNVLNENDIEDSKIIAKSLAKFILNLSDAQIILNEEKNVSNDKEEYYKLELIEIINGKPIQYITNKQEFFKNEFYVDENVLIPQPDTEVLVEEVLDVLNKNYNKNENVKVLDIGTGSGCIGISIAKNYINANVTMLDISKEALEIAKKNSNSILGNLSNIRFIESDMFDEVEEEFDVIVSNPPYISFEELKTLPEQVKNEPTLALYGFEDGLGFYKILIEESHKYLSDNGYICLEIGYNQKDDVVKLLKENKNYKNIYSKKDLSGNDRIVIAQRK